MILAGVVRAMKPLLALIRAKESRDDYNIVSHFVPHSRRPAKNLTTMTVGEILKMQEAWRAAGVKSTAVGAYQFIYKTLKAYYREAGLTARTKFGPSAQDKLAIALLNRRGLREWQSGNMADDSFMLGLAKEWASFPVPYEVNGKRPGQSYYAGDGLNAALTTVSAVQAALDGSRGVTPETLLMRLWRAFWVWLGVAR